MSKMENLAPKVKPGDQAVNILKLLLGMTRKNSVMRGGLETALQVLETSAQEPATATILEQLQNLQITTGALVSKHASLDAHLAVLTQGMQSRSHWKRSARRPQRSVVDLFTQAAE